MQIPEQVIYGILFSMFSGIILYILKEQKETRAKMEANQKEIKDKQEAQEIQLLKLEHNYKERFSNISLQIAQLDSGMKTEMKDIRHGQDNNMQRVLGAVERVSESVEDLKEQFKEIFDANPELKKP